jgi:hypothetical protein
MMSDIIVPPAEVCVADDKPPIPEHLRPFIDQARENHARRPPAPTVLVEPRGAGWSWASPHSDWEAWQVQLLDSFGTRSESVGVAFLGQIADVCNFEEDADGKRRPNAAELNTLLNMISGQRPKTELDAAILVQMAAVHFMVMRVAGSATDGSGWVDPVKAALLSKLANTFAKQMDALRRSQGKSVKQVIKVKYERSEHRHIHYHDGADGSREGSRQKPTRPQGPRFGSRRQKAVGDERGDAVQGEESQGWDVSGSSGPG